MPEGVNTITDHDADVNVRGEPCMHLNTPAGRGVPRAAGPRGDGLGDSWSAPHTPPVGERVAAPGS